MFSWLVKRFNSLQRPSSRLVVASDGQIPAITVLYANIDCDLLLERALEPTAPTPIVVSDPPKSRKEQPKQRRNRAIRFAKLFTEMTPQEAKLLFAIHRRNLRTLANESPAALQRDLHRFVLSSPGQHISRGKAAPSIAAVRSWVVEARQRISESKRSPANAAAKLAY